MKRKINKNNKKYENRPWLYWFDFAKDCCTNPKSIHFRTSGALGIKNKFKNANEVGELYFKDRAYKIKEPYLGRYDMKKDYSFENCRFLEFDKEVQYQYRQLIDKEPPEARKLKLMVTIEQI